MAGVAIATLTGENGVLTKASQAKEETELANAEEKIKLAIMGSRNESDGIFDRNKFEGEIEKENGKITSKDEEIIEIEMGNYEAIIDAITGEIIDIGITSISVKYEIMPEENIATSSKTIKIIAQNDKNGIKSITKPNGETENKNEVTFVVYENGTYQFIITDNANNQKKKNIKVKGINPSKIAIEKEITPTQEIYAPNKVIKLKAKNDEFGIESIKTPDGNSVDGDEATYTVTNSGNYTFVIKDRVGREIEETVTVSNVSPTCALYDNGNTLCGEFYGNNDKLDGIKWGGTRRIYIWKRLYGLSFIYKCKLRFTIYYV